MVDLKHLCVLTPSLFFEVSVRLQRGKCDSCDDFASGMGKQILLETNLYSLERFFYAPGLCHLLRLYIGGAGEILIASNPEKQDLRSNPERKDCFFVAICDNCNDSASGRVTRSKSNPTVKVWINIFYFSVDSGMWHLERCCIVSEDQIVPVSAFVKLVSALFLDTDQIQINGWIKRFSRTRPDPRRVGLNF